MNKLMFVMGFVIAAHVGTAATWYVSPSGSDANNGSSWALAKKTIQAGVDVASGGDTVLVTNGAYVLTDQVSITNGITVKSMNGASSTIVNGNYPVTTNRCFYLSDTNAILDGFTITNGCETKSYWNSGGGGVGNLWGTVQNCTISGNTATSGYGGGVHNFYGMVQNCTISGNTGGGMCTVGDNGTVRNCTIVGNTAINNNVGGMMNSGLMENCIVFYNRNGDVVNAFYGRSYYSCSPGLSGNGNISEDPQFIDPGSGYGLTYIPGDYRLKPYSPCINTGTNQDWMTNALDMAGNSRIINGIVDMGAYESTNAIMTRIAAPADVSASDGTLADKVQVTWSEVLGAGGYIVYRNTESNAHTPQSLSFPSVRSPYNDTNALPGSNYYYWVVATNSYGNSLLSGSAIGCRAASPFVPNNVTASDGTFTDRIRISWSAVSDASAYQVWRNTANDSSTAQLLGTISATNGEDTSVAANHIYYYWIRAVNGAGVSDFSVPNNGYALLGPYIRANGLDGAVVVEHGSNLTVTVEMNPGDLGVNADWWAVACANGTWYYLNSLMWWTPFDGNLFNSRPVYRGPLFNLSLTPIFNYTGLFAGNFQFWFAVDEHDGVLDVNGPVWYSTVMVHMQ